MSITVTTEVFCDAGDCQSSAAYASDSGKVETRLVRKQAKGTGWARIEGKDYCPIHKPKRATVLIHPEA